jgi:alpha-1,2-mannosyltransferase
MTKVAPAQRLSRVARRGATAFVRTEKPVVPAQAPGRARAKRRLALPADVRRAAELICFGAVPAFVLALALRKSYVSGFVDFHWYWGAGRDVLHGVSPYPSVADAARAAGGFVYPPPTAIAFVPLALLDFHIAVLLYTLAGFACIAGGLAALGVRDWRCYGAALLARPVLGAIADGTLTPEIFLALAVAYRYRDSGRGALAAAAAAVAKVFLAPALVWHAATRRLRHAAVAIAVGASVVFGAWWVIDFDGLAQYPALLRALSRSEGPGSYSFASLLHTGGLGWRTAELAGLAVGLAVIAGAAAVGRRSGADADRTAFCLVLLGCLLATPLVWSHYFMLLLIPLALSRPRLSALWLVPLATWPAHLPATGGGSLAALVFVWIVFGGAAVASQFTTSSVRSRVAGRRPAAARPAGPHRSAQI